MKKHTTGKCRISLEIENLIECDGVDIAVAKYSMPSKVLKLKCVQNWDEAKANASLICEAFNVANETGKTPRQLAEQNEKLLEALQVISPERLNDLAEFMDEIDYEKGFKGTEVQDDLRKMAKLSATAIRNTTK